MKDKEVEAALDEIKSRIKEVEQHLTKKKGPVVPWVGAMVRTANVGQAFYNDQPYFFSEKTHNQNGYEIIDSPLHPQFMPNDGENPWPDDIVVQVVFRDGSIGRKKSRIFAWSIIGGDSDIIGSRPACGWAEYLKECE